MIFHDMYEQEVNPVDEDCDDCGELGKVCFENDLGISNRIYE